MGAQEPVVRANAVEPMFIATGVRSPPVPASEVGFKAYNLARMAAIGLNVPPAFVLPATACPPREASTLSEGAKDQVKAAVRQLELVTGLAFGGSRRPLLVSVRSGAPISMPGMMDTVLNVGLNEETLSGLLRLTGNPRLVWDSYRRLVQQFAQVVEGCEGTPFEDAAARALRADGVERLSDLDYRALRSLAEEYLEIYAEVAGSRFPAHPMQQLEAAIDAVYRSWWGERACEYRRLNGIAESLGTAVTVQRMVFGNAGGASGAGVAFTRDPATGENVLYLDFAFNAQGEDVVSGREALEPSERVGERLPELIASLAAIRTRLEREFRDAQEIEFTVQDGELYLLQTRTGKRTPLAALRIAVEQAQEGLITREEALERLGEIDLEAIRERRFDARGARCIAHGVGASVGVACGAIALDPEAARRMAGAGQRTILVRRETVPDDISGIAAAEGILTALGGRTAHAAVVARQLGKVCVVSCTALAIDLERRAISLGDHRLVEGDLLSLDGASGAVYAGEVGIVEEVPARWLEPVRAWSKRE